MARTCRISKKMSIILSDPRARSREPRVPNPRCEVGPVDGVGVRCGRTKPVQSRGVLIGADLARNRIPMLKCGELARVIDDFEKAGSCGSRSKQALHGEPTLTAIGLGSATIKNKNTRGRWTNGPRKSLSVDRKYMELMSRQPDGVAHQAHSVPSGTYGRVRDPSRGAKRPTYLMLARSRSTCQQRQTSNRTSNHCRTSRRTVGTSFGPGILTSEWCKIWSR